MRDNLPRRILKRLALWRYTIDLRFTRAVESRRQPPEYRLCGECNGCGACCETPTIATNRWFFYSKVLRWLTLTWHREVNGFAFVAADRETHSYSFRCTHYDPATRLCDSYDSRPGMCRDYPLNLVFAYRPEFLPDCGYYALHVDADAIRESLEELPDLTPEKRERLAKEFYVWQPPAEWAGEGEPGNGNDGNDGKNGKNGMPEQAE